MGKLSRLARMTLSADLYFSFRSPYSYLAIGRYRALAEEYDIDITLRTVLPIAVRDPDILFTGNPCKSMGSGNELVFA